MDGWLHVGIFSATTSTSHIPITVIILTATTDPRSPFANPNTGVTITITVILTATTLSDGSLFQHVMPCMNLIKRPEIYMSPGQMGEGA